MTSYGKFRHVAPTAHHHPLALVGIVTSAAFALHGAMAYAAAGTLDAAVPDIASLAALALASIVAHRGEGRVGR